jgi:hypothetical protein
MHRSPHCLVGLWYDKYSPLGTVPAASSRIYIKPADPLLDGTVTGRSRTSSIRPYSLAAAPFRKKSRCVSALTFSNVWLV